MGVGNPPQRRGGGGGGRGRGRGKHRRQDSRADLSRLKEWIEASAPPRGALGLGVREDGKRSLVIGADGTAKQDEKGSANKNEFPSFTGVKNFSELPVSQATLDGLKAAKFVTMTAVQRATLPHALCGRDVLGAAKTGSGKTLAFVIPLLETLHRQQWSQNDGLGGLMMTPTRELALQIFDELRKVGKRHTYSAGLLIGGKSVKEEQRFVNGMNVLVATPGRLLQHMDETPGFDCDNIQVLVLDEADRILDMGFSQTLNAILENLKSERQTLLFSATQTRSVKDLARLSLKDPEYISVHADTSAPTPVKLRQGVVTCAPHEKLDMLWSFLRSHLLNKTICFLSTCKQVRFVFESFKRLRPGVPLRMLHGKMKQMRRMAVFYEFCEAKEMVLFATDIASRGLDFPSVDWVLQMDCPEDVPQYIHRVGRTARFTAAGHALMYLTPGEQGMLQQLKDANVQLSPIKVNPSKLQTVTPALQALVSKSTELKDLAQRALVSYLRCVFLAPNKAVFDVTTINIPDFSASVGLLVAPKLRFLKKAGKGTAWNAGADDEAKAAEDDEDVGGAEEAAGASGGEDDGDSEYEEEAQKAKETVADKPARFKIVHDVDGDEDDFLSVKRHLDNADGEGTGADRNTALPAPKKPKKLKIKVGAANPHASRVVFDDDGNVRNPLELLAMEDRCDSGDDGAGAVPAADGEGLDAGVHDSSSTRMQRVAEIMRKRDQEDRKKDKLKRKEKKLEQKAKAKRAAMDSEGMEAHAVLGSSNLDGDSASEYEDGDKDSGDEAPGDVLVVGRSSSGHDSSDESDEGEPRSAGAKTQGSKFHARNPEDLASMSVEDKQALAMQLLRKGRR